MARVAKEMLKGLSKPRNNNFLDLIDLIELSLFRRYF